MKVALLGLASVVLVSATPAPPPALYMTGEQLMQKCASASRGPEGLYEIECVGYIQGVADSFAMLAHFKGEENCVPPRIAVGTVEQIVLSDLRAQSDRSGNASMYVINALSRAFRCESLMR